MSRLTLYELPPSPNNVRARLGLGFKGLPFEREILSLDDYPGDRGNIINVSGQPRVPVLRHGETVVFDSGAILRYLEANFRDTPPLFSESFQEFGEIERWESFGRGRVTEPIGMVFGQAFAPSKDPDTLERANSLMRDLTGQIEGQLSATGYLVGGRLTAADLGCVPLVRLAMLRVRAGASPVERFFSENLVLGDGRERTRAWVDTVMAHDPAGV